jgi:tight adherence protein B
LLLVGLAWAVVSALALALGDRPDAAILILGALVAMPWLFLRRARGRRRRALEETQDALIVSWADALTTTPNLGEAIASSAEFLGEPLRGEIDKLLAQLRLGVDIETALQLFSDRLSLPGLEAATCAAILCRRTGGDLPGMLRRIAASTREIARLEGVVRTKTAEGRYQAWVMGGIPLGLLLLLDKLNPAWIAPLWQDPIGWVLLALAAVMEIAAVALIRKITSFEF